MNDSSNDTASGGESPPEFNLEWMPSGKKAVIRLYSDRKLIHTDELTPTKDRDRERFAKKASELGASFEDINQQLLSVSDEFLLSTSQASSRAAETQPLDSMDDYVVAEAEEILRTGDPLRQAYDDAVEIGLVGEHKLIAILYLIGVSRLLTKPMAAIVQGSSSSGKSYSIEKVAELFPPESKLLCDQMTPQALFHMPPGSLKNRFVVAGERSRLENDDRAEGTRALREMLSSGCLRKLMPVKMQGGIETVLIEQEGPIAFVESTTLGNIFDEDLNRCILLHTDESQEQTKRILRAAAKRRQTDGALDAINRQHAIQRLLVPRRVYIPYSSRLAEVMPADKVEARRAFGMILNCIEASALLHQYQRQVDGGEIVANEKDYQVAFALMAGPMGESLGRGVSDAAAEYWRWLASCFRNVQSFCTNDVLNRADNPKRTERTYSIIQELNRANCLHTVETKGRQKFYRIGQDPIEAGSPLPAPTEFFASVPTGIPEMEREFAETP